MNHVHQICCSPLPFYRIKGYIDHNNQSQACAVPVTGLCDRRTDLCAEAFMDHLGLCPIPVPSISVTLAVTLIIGFSG